VNFFLIGHSDKVYGLKLVSTNVLASVSKDTTIKLWNTVSGTLIRTLSGHTNTIFQSVDMLYDGQTLVSGSFDKTIKLWSIKTGQCSKTFDTGVSIQSLAVLNLTSTSNYFLFTGTVVHNFPGGTFDERSRTFLNVQVPYRSRSFAYFFFIKKYYFKVFYE
jgi:WD40 repeat protein